MSLTRLNATAATLTKNRTEDSVSPFSGMCVTCVDGCIGMCEIGKSAYRGAEVIYPQPFGIITAASEKNYPVDLSHFTIMGTAVGAKGIAEDSNVAIFPNVKLETRIGKDPKIKVRLPFIIPGLGSTNIAKNNWEGLAVGSALSGTHHTCPGAKRSSPIVPLPSSAIKRRHLPVSGHEGRLVNSIRCVTK